MPEPDMTLPTLPDISLHPGIKMSTTKPEVEIPLNENRWQSDCNDYPIFSTMPDLDMALPTRPDVSLHLEPKMSIKNRKWKPEV